MPTPRPGEVWLVRFPFTDLTTTKQRPAFVIATHGEDIIVAGIFSRVPAKLRATWVLIDDEQIGFELTGLKKSSIPKAEKIDVIHELVFQRKLGYIQAALLVGGEHVLKNAMMIVHY